MAQPVFPTLSRKESSDSFERSYAYDPTIRSQFDDGAYQVMARATKAPLQWSWQLKFLSKADYATLLAFYEDDANFGAVPVKWEDPVDKIDYFVHFLNPPTMTADTGNGGQTCTVKINFVQAIGVYT